MGDPGLVQTAEPRQRLDRNQCLQALRAPSRARPFAAADRLHRGPRSVAARCIVRELFHETTGLNADGFRSVCVRSCRWPDTDALLRATARLRRCGPRAVGRDCYDAMARSRPAGARAIQTSTASRERERREWARDRAHADHAAIGSTNATLIAQSSTVTPVPVPAPCHDRRASDVAHASARARHAA
jgi:hypothetical protein